MICPRCKTENSDKAMLCEHCGTRIYQEQLANTAVGLRQGKNKKERITSYYQSQPDYYADEDMYFDIQDDEAYRTSKTYVSAAPETDGKVSRVNWTLLCLLMIILIILIAMGGIIYLKYTDSGQLILARMGMEVNSNATWNYAQELLDQGYVERSVEMFEKAYAQDEGITNRYERLMQLSEAYIAAGQTKAAELIYLELCEIEPTNPEPYRLVVRLMEDQGRRLELASFLQAAYENTKEISFRRQREELIPSTPTATLASGRLKFEQDTELVSKEGYDIYYILGANGDLPEDGQKFEDPIHLTEGTHILRAVAVSNDLVSDELNITYTITLPTPSAPYPSLPPGTYENQKKIWLRYIQSEDELLSTDEKEHQITIYYTIDGQTPTSNSPIFDGEGFYLPIGSCTLKAVAVNGYGKVSNVLERTYKITKGSFPRYFNSSDNFSVATIMTTTRDEFVKKMGGPLTEQDITDNTIRGLAIKLTYNWGEARFVMSSTGYVLYQMTTNSASIVGPRKTKIGFKETEVTEKFRDMGQTNDQNGDRSIYWENKNQYAKLYHLDNEHDRIDYVYIREDNGLVTLSYYLENNIVTSIRIAYSM